MFSRLEPLNPRSRVAGWLARKDNARRAGAEDVLEEWGFVADLGEQLDACYPNARHALVITMLHVPIMVLAVDAGLDQAPVPTPVLVARCWGCGAWSPGRCRTRYRSPRPCW